MTTQSDASSHSAAYSDLALHQLLKQMSILGARLDPSVESAWVVKRVQFFAYELRAKTPLGSSAREVCEILNSFFFTEKGFAAVPKPNELTDSAPAYLMHNVLQNRAGAPVVFALLYSFLAGQIGLRLEFVDLRPTSFLKFVENGASHFIDLSRQGRILNSDDLLDVVHSRLNLTAVPSSALLDHIPCEKFFCDYLSALKLSFVKRGDHQALLIIQNALLENQPSNLQFLGERALLNRKLGHFKNALSDLKRYFSFSDRSKAPAELVRVHDELVTLLEKQRTTIQIID